MSRQITARLPARFVRENAVSAVARTLAVVSVMTVDELQQFLLDSFPDNPPDTIVEAVSDAGVRLRLPVSAKHGRPGETVSGPALMALADSAAWLSVIAQIGPVALAVTTSLHIDFLRKASLVDDVLAEGRLLKLGQRLGVTEVYLRSADVLVAKAQVTYSIPPR
jgi:uncharacterized protein (TIGR00369 family)